MVNRSSSELPKCRKWRITWKQLQLELNLFKKVNDSLQRWTVWQPGTDSMETVLLVSYNYKRSWRNCPGCRLLSKCEDPFSIRLPCCQTSKPFKAPTGIRTRVVWKHNSMICCWNHPELKESWWPSHELQPCHRGSAERVVHEILEILDAVSRFLILVLYNRVEYGGFL